MTDKVLPKKVDKELGYSIKEFLATLARQKIFLQTRQLESHIEISFASGKVDIYFLEETERRIASMRLPLLKVRMEFFSLNDAEEKRFFNHFLRAFQKGGG